MTYVNYGPITKYLNQRKPINGYGMEIKNKQP